ncbi:MAG: ABC-type transport auxiliary lipoprotein family protein [Pseudomonadota bacterium]
MIFSGFLRDPTGFGAAGSVRVMPSAALRLMPSLAAFLLLAVMLSGCALFGKTPDPKDTYELRTPAVSSAGVGGTRAQLLVKLPTALKALNSDRMILRPTASSITYLSGTQWSDTLPRMLQAKWVAAFENTASTGATAKPGDGLVIDYQLVIDIRRFEIDQTGAETARLEVSVKLLTDSNGKVLRTRVFKASAPVRGTENADYVAGFNDAFSTLTRDVVRWVLRLV